MPSSQIDELGPESIRLRLDAISREHSLTRWAGTALFGTLVAFLAWAGLPSRAVMCTERLELRDRQGRLRAELALDRHDGTPRLVLIDAAGNERIALAAHDKGSTLGLSGQGGSRVDLSTVLVAPGLGLWA